MKIVTHIQAKEAIFIFYNTFSKENVWNWMYIIK